MNTLHILTRVSTSNQTEEKGGTSLSTQRVKGIELSKSLGMKYEIHNEGGASSSTDNLETRPVLLQLLRRIDKGEIKHLYVWNTDRLSRNTSTWFLIRQKMVKQGVVLYTSTGKYDTTGDMENLILGILSEISQYDNKIRSERSRLGKIEKVKSNFFRGGDPPFGYQIKKLDKGSILEPHPEESKHIMTIFSLYQQGYSIKEIKYYLEHQQVQTRRGNKHWSLGSIQVILRNECYIGKQSFNDKKSGLTIDYSCTPIISKRLFQEVKEIRKLKLEKRGQLNRTTRSFLFRDYIFCSCGRPIGGRVKETQDVNHYYCPLSERRFNMSIEMSLDCDMKRCLNIPTTEDFLWNSIITTLKENKHLSHESKTLLKSDIVDFRNIIGQQLDDIESRLIMLEQRKEKIKKSLVEVEKRQLYGEYDGSEVYESLKKSLNKDLDDVSVEVDHLVGLKKVDSDHKKWYNNYKSIVNYICGIESWEEDLKREFLRLILHRIDLSYNHTDQTHDLNTILKIPLHNSTTKSGTRSSTPMVIKHLKTSVNTGKSTPISAAYSTVTDFSPTGSVFLVINILFKSPNLWVSPYSQYQQRLFNIIRSLHEEQGKNFVEICNYLISNGYKSTRGKDLTQSIVWSIYTKKKKSIQRFGRVFDPVITDVKLDLIDYFP